MARSPGTLLAPGLAPPAGDFGASFRLVRTQARIRKLPQIRLMHKIRLYLCLKDGLRQLSRIDLFTLNVENFSLHPKYLAYAAAL